MKILNKKIATLALMAMSASAVFAQGPPPPPNVPLDGGLTALIVLIVAGGAKLYNDKKRKN